MNEKEVSVITLNPLPWRAGGGKSFVIAADGKPVSGRDAQQFAANASNAHPEVEQFLIGLLHQLRTDSDLETVTVASKYESLAIQCGRLIDKYFQDYRYLVDGMRTTCSSCGTWTLCRDGICFGCRQE